MGYYSTFEIVVDGVDPDEYGRVANALREISGYNFVVWDNTIDSEDSCKWYDHVADLKVLSERYPDATFQLRAVGEDGDRWVVVTRNGKSYREDVTPRWPEVDESRL